MVYILVKLDYIYHHYQKNTQNKNFHFYCSKNRINNYNIIIITIGAIINIMKNNITFKAIKIGNHRIRNQYFILAGSKQIGEIVFMKKNKIFIIGFIRIYEEYRNHNYGYKVIEHILSHYKINCIVGKTLNQSKGFWNKCIKKFNGQRKNISVCDNCSSSFMIPKCNISNEQMHELLEISYEII